MFLTDIRVGGHILSKHMCHFIYEIICLTEYTEADIKSIKDYESFNDREAAQAVDEFINACKAFKVAYMLLQKKLPPPDEVKIIMERDNQNCKYLIKINAIDKSVPHPGSTPNTP